MKTIFFSDKTEDIRAAAQIIKDGGLVVFPTETVYGLGADAFNESAVAKIFAAKQRPLDKAITLHISSFKQLEDCVLEVTEDAKKLTEKFWPGPLTIILKKNNQIPKITTGGKDTVGIRMPENKTALELIESAGKPLAAPSANISGNVSPTCASACKKDLEGKVDAIIDGGNTRIGVESTVIDMSLDVPQILRQGAISKAQIEDVLGKAIR